MIQKQQCVHGDPIINYWTRERLQNAIPEPGKYEDQQIGMQKMVGLEQEPTAVDDKTRKTPPYNSVGQIAYTKKSSNYKASAYVVNTGKGKNILFTAAHNLLYTSGEAENIIFIPALQEDGGAPYGKFPQIAGGQDKAWFVAKGYVESGFSDGYDVGAIKLKRNESEKEVGDVVPMLDYKVDLKCEKGSTEWKTIGYIGNTMYESDGTYIKTDEEGRRVLKTNAGKKGMSGSPWLLKKLEKYTHANGDHVSHGVDDSRSPYYSTALIVDDLIARL